MRWQDIVTLIEKGEIHPDDIVFVYDQTTGDEHEADLIEFDDNGEIMIVINHYASE